MVDTVANRQEVCEAWFVTPNVVSYEYCIGVLTGLPLYGINADDVILGVMPTEDTVLSVVDNIKWLVAFNFLNVTYVENCCIGDVLQHA